MPLSKDDLCMTIWLSSKAPSNHDKDGEGVASWKDPEYAAQDE